MKHLTIDLNASEPPTRDSKPGNELPVELPEPQKTLKHPLKPGGENASIFFIGTATTVIEWEGVRIMTDPNFLHAGDHVHLGPGVTGTRQTNPAVDLHDLPRIDLVLLSHYHADHFDQEVEASLRRSLPIITTPHAKSHLSSKAGEGEAFTQVHDLDFFDEMFVDIQGTESRTCAMKVVGMPGKHVPPGILGKANDVLHAVPPTNGWMLELGYGEEGKDWQCGYRIYISGDTLLVPELDEIAARYSHLGIDLLLLHLGGTTIPSSSIPLLMVTMDAEQGVKLIQLVKPDIAIPIHYDDYDVFLTPLSEFQKAVKEANLDEKVVYLERKDKYAFNIR